MFVIKLLAPMGEVLLVSEKREALVSCIDTMGLPCTADMIDEMDIKIVPNSIVSC